MAGGAQCRSWDDFLILSAQSWAQLRDELVSGRLVDYLRRIGRPDLIPHAAADRSPDDRLDDWLARIPATQSSAPELDVHPASLVVQAKMGGGVTRLSLRITNVGFRLLRSSVRIEPADAHWVKLLAGQDGRPFLTIDQTEIPLDVELPEKIDRMSRAVIVIESTGGTRRVEVRVERPADPLLVAEPGAGAAVFEIPILARELRGRLAKVGLVTRAAVCCGAAIGFRLLTAVANVLPLGGAGKSLAEPRISSIAIITVAIGVVAGLLLAKRRGERARSIHDRNGRRDAGPVVGCALVFAFAKWRAAAGLMVDLAGGRLLFLGGAGGSRCSDLFDLRPLPLGTSAGRPMMAKSMASALVFLCLLSAAHGQGKGPADDEIAQAIAKGVEFLRGEQSDRGEWIEPAQNQHPLGMTALAGLALLENGVAREAREISKAREIVTSLRARMIRLTTWRWRSYSLLVVSKRDRVKPMR